MNHTIRRAEASDAGALADLASVTFPLACPPSSSPADIAAHLAAHLGVDSFRKHLADPDTTLLVSDDGGALQGYVMLVARVASDPDVASALTDPAALELSKCYVHPASHGRGAAAALMAAGISAARDGGAPGIWLGVNDQNARAIRFYEKSGFLRVGTKTFTLGNTVEHDYVMELRLAR